MCTQLPLIRAKGFALPTILLASTLLLIVLTSAVASAGSIGSALQGQYYRRLAHEAAESGAVYAKDCMKQNSYTTPWVTNGQPLTPDRDCNGTVVSGNSPYVAQVGNLRTTFSVDAATRPADGVTVLSIQGTTELLTAQSGRVWKTYSMPIRQLVSINQLVATASASGHYEVCGILNGNAWCWGDNTYGQLGDGTTTDSVTPVKVLRVGDLLGSVDTNISIGDMNVCLVSGGEVFCWGRNNNGQLGNNTQDTGPHSNPVNISSSSALSGKTATQVATSTDSTCAIASGNYYCWGNNNYYSFGTGNTTNSSVPIQGKIIGATYGKSVTYITGSVYDHHRCAIASGTAYCWGSNSGGQLGDGTTTDRSQPTAVNTTTGLAGKTIVQIVTGGITASAQNGYPQDQSHSCALTSIGEVYCWGTNYQGQLGNGAKDSSNHTLPAKIGGALVGKNVVQIGAGFAATCALTSDGAIYCWGDNSSGQVGDNGPSTPRTSPSQVAVQTPGLAGKTVTNLTVGANRGCAIAGSSTYCWGSNTQGQIGDGTSGNNRYVPTESTFLRPPASIIFY